MTLDQIIESVVRERLAEDDSPGEIGEHLQGAVLDAVRAVAGADLDALDLLTDALALVRWGNVTADYIDRVEGVNRWEI